MPVPGAQKGPPPATSDVVVIGAGIQGLATAYELSKHRPGTITVLDANYPGWGASGRNGEFIRSGFGSKEWTRLLDLSLRKWHGLSAELDFNVLFEPCGHLHLADTEEGVAHFRSLVELHRSLGVETELLDHDATMKLAPALSPDLVAGSIYQADAGTAHHDAAVWAYARAAGRRGVRIHPWTEVTGLDVDSGGITAVRTSRGTISSRTVVVAAGGFSRKVAELAGAEIPTETIRLEALVTESYKPFIRPVLGLRPLLAYMRQTARGEIVGGAQLREMEPSERTGGSLKGLRDACQKLVRAVPQLANARVVRYWAGLAEVTADVAPAVGPVPGIAGMWISCGWTYGFMGGPATGVLLAQAIVEEQVPEILAPFSVERLLEGRYIEERAISVLPMSEDA